MSLAQTEHPEGRLRVLIIDDNHDCADSMALLLAFQGFEVRACYDGRKGIETALAWRPDVALLDLVLPGLSGFEVAERLCACQESPPFLIAISGLAREEDKHRSAAAGIDLHLAKPANPDLLLAFLRGLLKQRRGQFQPRVYQPVE